MDNFKKVPIPALSWSLKDSTWSIIFCSFSEADPDSVLSFLRTFSCSLSADKQASITIYVRVVDDVLGRPPYHTAPLVRPTAMVRCSVNAPRTMEESFRGLQKFLVRNVVRTRRELGVGAHGSVEELQADGMIYAGKKIHDALVEFSINNTVVTQRFVEECQLMSDLRHPHVVQFIGVCFLSGSRLPVLVMEYLPENLDHLLETMSNIPLFLLLKAIRLARCCTWFGVPSQPCSSHHSP